MKPDRSWILRRKDCFGVVIEEFRNKVDDLSCYNRLDNW